MGKRKNSEPANSQKEKKPSKFDASPAKKRNAESSDSDSEMFEEETIAVEAEETRHDEGPLNYEPDQFRLLVESFNEYINANQLSTSSVHNMEKYVADWIKNQNEIIDTRCFTTDYRKYLRQAMKFRNFALNDASNTLISYLSGEKSLPVFPSYPDRPPTKFQLYVKKNNIEFKGISGSATKSIYERMQKDEEGTREVDEEHHELNAQFITQLQAFHDSHPNLTEDQKKNVTNKIKILDKKVHPKPGTSKTPRGKKEKKDPETAFSLFCRSKADKYRDLSEEEREKKLCKKFAKLPAETRDLFEGLALNLK